MQVTFYGLNADSPIVDVRPIHQSHPFCLGTVVVAVTLQRPVVIYNRCISTPNALSDLCIWKERMSRMSTTLQIRQEC